MKFSLVNLGCKVNRVESDSIAADLLAAGWTHVDEGADVCIVNTCTVTAEADRKTRKEVNRAVARNAGAPVLVTGCAATMDPSAYTALSQAVRVVDKGDVVREALALSGEEFVHEPVLLRVGDAFPTRVGVKVQDGCDNACTFCIVHVARGKAWSVSPHEIERQVAAHAHAGVREIVLTGIDLGAYSYDGATLADLVLSLRACAPEVRLRISSIEPVTIDERLIDVLATQDGMVCRHLHVPLQSGSSKVLRDMARRYTADEYADIIASLKEAVPHLSLSTDVIVGFPGETEDDFLRTMEMAQTCGFARMHLFRYSKRAGTPAALREDQVPTDVVANRMARMSELANRLRKTDAEGRIGARERILVESQGKGMSESYYEVRLHDHAQRGQLIEATLRTYKEEDGTFTL